MTGAEPGADQASPRPAQFRPPRVAEFVAGILRDRIIDGDLARGDSLPKQEDLMAEFRISRPTLREALRHLENEGLLTVRRGSIGGSVVEVPTAATSAYTFGLVLQSRKASISDLAAAIEQIEPLAAALCAARPDRMDAVLPGLRANVERTAAAIDDGEEFTKASREFHELMVSACGNETVIVMVGALESLWSEQERQWAARVTSEGRYPDTKQRRAVLAAHTALLDAIAAGDGEAARKIDAGHVTHSQRYALENSESQVIRATALRDSLRDLGK
ncbi:FadR/GntR family transcriptional regulator [Pseudofrankia inefficax]|uniref:Regulatory protein GntR HTH n=1 Tax=Pseudofrankia inefficax (strain DSM 45817 / CECT 9037 / DDB 130130 / EuI1c) TaxID=298654 RepID=E3IVB3_PSEI1|nr:FCD domain-containing protein [Pseudofrankia inefficax]ADP81277.1 regulatory protein GntR HTH [Pseudofrankia inefficax]